MSAARELLLLWVCVVCVLFGALVTPLAMRYRDVELWAGACTSWVVAGLCFTALVVLS